MSTDMERCLDDVQRAVAELTDVGSVKNTVMKALNSGVNPTDIVGAMSRGLEEVGERYEKGQYFLSELIMAGIVAVEITNILKPHLEKSAEKPLGKVVIGTIKGDLHDIGKNIVISMFSSIGFRIIDLGIDVSAEDFLKAVRGEKPDIVAMSCLLTMGMDEMKKVIEKLNEAGLRKDVKIMVGGRPVTLEFAKEIGADAYGSDAVEAVKIAKALTKGGSA